VVQGHARDPRLDELATLIASSPHNLVSRGERGRVRAVHIAEAVAVAGVLPIVPGARWMDLGTGGGLPGLVLALVHPATRWVLVDSVAKKAGAVRGFAARLGLENVEVRCGRAEKLAREDGMRESADGVVSRALAPLPALVELSRGFVPRNGWIVAIKGRRWAAEVRAAGGALEVCRVAIDDVVGLPTTTRTTWVVTMRATAPVPEAVPRAVGVPIARPLRGGLL
jgi:16S rRNA (guanine527-N7)-methyltransferase